MWKTPEYKIINTASEVTMYSYISKGFRSKKRGQ
ncbi:pyrroloquinoline quinone precursor peptide PqqA [Salinibacillus aidingensis]